jgi:hypothetical protein
MDERGSELNNLGVKDKIMGLCILTRLEHSSCWAVIHTLRLEPWL